ncbi:gliding motility-associated C-terminal domain-containing protein [Roseivirga sp.]|uniref:gliding motility-associated C-terminal domain-containing protein n=1 Tax=Roseivirga sp. TaxID=1964215 RepID=UPI003B517243
MNKLLPVLFTYFLINSLTVHAQVFISGEKSLITSAGEAKISLNNIHLVNNGQMNLKSSQIKVRSTQGDIYLEGTQTPEVFHFELDTDAELVLKSDLIVHGNFSLTNGSVDLTNHFLTLLNNESSLIGENAEKRILSSGDGEIIKYYTSEISPNQNIGNLGLLFSSFEYRDTLTIRRGHTTLPIPFGESITRYYKVRTRKNPEDKVDLGLTYFEDEVVVKDPGLEESIWVLNDGEWSSIKPTRPGYNKGNEFLIEAEVKIYESIITVGLYRRLVDQDIIPTAFTPNNDGFNDKFIIPGIEKLPNAEVSIYDKFGRQVYSTKDYGLNPWDGVFNGKTLPYDTYQYQIVDPKNPLEFLEGLISIIK